MARFRPARTGGCVTNIDRSGTDYANSYVCSAVSPPEGVSAKLPVKRTAHLFIPVPLIPVRSARYCVLLLTRRPKYA